MPRFSVLCTVTAACVGVGVASADVLGHHAVVAHMVAGEVQSPSQTRVLIDGRLPIRLRKNEDGVLVPASNGTVTFVHNGKVIRESSLGIGLDGTVYVSELHAGPYSVFIRGGGGFAAFGTWLNPPTERDGEPDSAIDVGLVPVSDMPIVQQIISHHLRNPSPLVAQMSDLLETTADAGQVAMSEPVAFKEPTQGYGFEIDADGVVHGRIVHSAPPSDPLTPVAGLRVYFVRSGKIVAKSQTDEKGMFHTAGLSPGVVTLVVSGTNAFLAFAADVQPAARRSFAATPPHTELPPDVPPGTEEVSTVDGETVVAQSSPVFSTDLQYVMTQAPAGGGSEGGSGVSAGDAGGGFIGTGGGGGSGGGIISGGGGGGSGVGRLLGGARIDVPLGQGNNINAAATALANDNDDPMPVVSPAVP